MNKHNICNIYKNNSKNCAAFEINNATLLLTNSIKYAIIFSRGEGKHPKAASVRKEKAMEDMTNEQFKTIIEMILQIIKDNDKDEAIKKIEALLNK